MSMYQNKQQQLLTSPIFIIIREMRQLFSKMRDLSIKELKLRRQAIFEHTRLMIMQHQQSFEVESASESQQMSTEAMEIEHPVAIAKARKKKQAGQRIRSYWKRLLQVSQWMVEIPHNLNEFMMTARAEGSKCLLIFQGHRLEVRDKSGRVQLQTQIPSKTYDGTILEVFFSQEHRTLVINDLIVWKHNPMTSSEFEFRQAWVLSNLNRAIFSTLKEIDVSFSEYVPCETRHLQAIYQKIGKKVLDGILFVHRQSPYLHGLNPNVLLWKDRHTSPYFEKQVQQNLQKSRGVGLLTKTGEVLTLEKVSLFKADRNFIDPTHRFARFEFSGMTVHQTEQEEMTVQLHDFQICDTTRNHNGPVDSLSRLLFRASLKQGCISIEDIGKAMGALQVKKCMMHEE